MNLTMVYDSLQVLHINRSYPTKNEYFPKYIQITTIHLLNKRQLNHNNYYEQKINMNYFIQANGYDMEIHAKVQDLNMHGFL
jgi:hypothetical protein